VTADQADERPTPTGPFDSDLWAGWGDGGGAWSAAEPPDDPPDAIAAQAIASGQASVPLAMLPEEFWGARQLFKDIRQAAHATLNSADAVLGCILARASAMVHRDLKFDSGRGPTGSMNQFVALVARSGIGKSTASECAEGLILPPTHLSKLDGTTDPDRFRDGVGLGTGEGMAEAYMGWAERDTGEVHKSGPNRGEPKTEKYRTQVRHNAYLYLDEGQTLTKMMKERQGTTIGATIRTAWGGGPLGQANAQETTTRFVARGSYSMGMVICYQPAVAQDLLADGAPGTPQRFLWLSAIDTNIPEEAPHCPDPFRLPIEDRTGRPITGVVEFPQALKTKLRREHLAKVRGEVEVEELDSHAPLMLCKLAALLAVLDERLAVSHEDWELANLIWRVSCATRDRLIEFGRREAERRHEEKIAGKIAEVEAASLASREVDHNIDRVARLISRRVRAAEKPVVRYLLKKNIGSDNKRFFDTALSHAKNLQWVSLDDEEREIVPGKAVPA
jgi:hypothetical protein